MYKIFVNQNLIFLTNKVPKETDFQFFLLDTVDLESLFTKMYHNKILKVVLCDSDKKILKKFKSKIPVIKAAGGLVFNKKGEILFIFRNKKWDLPKGGVEKKERIKDAAMREVQEETGVDKLKIIRKLQKTYHIFKKSGVYKLKVTHWYRMVTDFEGSLIGQTSEGIEKAVWLKPNEVNGVLKNSYENIKLLFPTGY